jgi:hypothetical protein
VYLSSNAEGAAAMGTGYRARKDHLLSAAEKKPAILALAST